MPVSTKDSCILLKKKLKFVIAVPEVEIDVESRTQILSRQK